MKTRSNDHALRVTRTLALLSSLAVFGASSAGCGASVSATDGGGEDRSQPADSQTLACVCCPSGDLSGRCAVSSGGSGDRAPMPADAGSGFILPADAGSGVPFIPDSGSSDPPPDASGEAPQVDAGGIAPPPPPIDSGAPMDASVTYIDPPAGQRWCTVMDLYPARPNGPSCPVPGPLPPPEMDR